MEQTKQDSDQRAIDANSSDAAIGRRIREAREAKALTQKHVSVRSKWVDAEGKGVSRTALIGYEAGTSRPGTRELRILCEALHVTPNYLIYGSEQPFQAQHAALEGLQNKRRQVQIAMQVAFLVMALEEHEKGALLSLAASLAGRQLGDERLSGLRGFAGMLTTDIVEKLRGYVPDLTDEEFDSLALPELANRLSREVSMNIGTKLIFDDNGEVVGGEQTYPDPDG